MTKLIQTKKPTKIVRELALESYPTLEILLSNTNPGKEKAEIEFEGFEDKIELPIEALNLLAQILREMSEGKTLSLFSEDTVLTTQQAAEILGCSRPYLIKILEEGKLKYTLIGKHRRILLSDLLEYRKSQKIKQKKILQEIMDFDEESGLYDT